MVMPEAIISTGTLLISTSNNKGSNLCKHNFRPDIKSSSDKFGYKLQYPRNFNEWENTT